MEKQGVRRVRKFAGFLKLALACPIPIPLLARQQRFFLKRLVLGRAFHKDGVCMEDLVLPIATFQDDLGMRVEEQIRQHPHESR